MSIGKYIDKRINEDNLKLANPRDRYNNITMITQYIHEYLNLEITYTNKAKLPNKTGFPKKFMTINELVEIGLSRDELKNLVRTKDFPSFKLTAYSKTASWRVDTDKLNDWIKKRMKDSVSELQKGY